MKQCRVCKEFKPLEDFAVKKASKDGRNGICKKCDKEKAQRYRDEDPARANASSKRSKKKHEPNVKARLRKHYRKNSTRIMDQMKEALKKNPANGLFKIAKYRAARVGVPFTITVEDIKVPEFCPVLGLRLEFGSSKQRGTSPSIDRLVPELGYVPGNIAVISYRANRIKNDGTVEEHLKIAAWMTSQLTPEPEPELVLA